MLVDYRLHKDMELDEATITALIQKDTLQKGYSLAINYLSYRMRTKKEIRDYLQTKEVDEEHITKIMDKLAAQGLTDDKQFADAFVRTRISTAAKGPMLVQQELLEKGVDAALAAEAVEQYTYDVQFDKAMKLAIKKRNTGKNKSFRQQLQQLQGTLTQKGFTRDVVQAVSKELQDEKDDDAEWEALVKQGEKLIRKYQQKQVAMNFAKN